VNRKGFFVYEDATPEQVANLLAFYHPYLKLKIMPIVESEKTIKAFLETRQWI